MNINKRGVMYICRQLLRFFINLESFNQEIQGNFMANINPFVTYDNSCSLFRIFQTAINNDFSQKSISSQFSQLNILLTIFEMALFNKQIMDLLKSSALIIQRQRLFEFLEENIVSIEEDLSNLQKTKLTLA